ncbi:hypothetical protein [Methylocaldum szegediense]|nr:hypothetical protein [Methylocaldum szegediense]
MSNTIYVYQPILDSESYMKFKEDVAKRYPNCNSGHVLIKSLAKLGGRST